MEKSIRGFENYKVTDDGRVIGARGNYLKVDVNSVGYHRVSLCKDGKVTRRFVHQLVLETFSPNEGEPDLVVNHIDGDRQNNNLSNLEWVTRSYNVKDGWSRGRTPPHLYDKETLDKLEEMFNSGYSGTKAAKALGRDRSAVCRVFKELRERATTIRKEYTISY